MASATTEVLVDTPQSAVHDLRQGSSEFDKMTNRAVLMGNVMASPPVLEYIARRAGPPGRPDQRRSPADAGLPAPAERLRRERDPATSSSDRPVPAQHPGQPDRPGPGRLLPGAGRGVGEEARQRRGRRLARLPRHDRAEAQGTPPGDIVRLTQLGRAKGVVVNGGIRFQLALATFLVVFGLAPRRRS